MSKVTVGRSDSQIQTTGTGMVHNAPAELFLLGHYVSSSR